LLALQFGLFSSPYGDAMEIVSFAFSCYPFVSIVIWIWIAITMFRSNVAIDRSSL